MAFLPATLFIVSALLLGYLGTRPPVEVNEQGLRIGSKTLSWREFRSIVSTSWNSPLVLNLTMAGGERRRLIYPGDVQSADRLMRQIRRMARNAAVDGVVRPAALPDVAPIQASQRGLPTPPVRLLRPEDEADVLRIYRELKSTGRYGSLRGRDDQGEPAE